MEKRKIQSNVALTYPKHKFKPEDILNFVESTNFSNQWDEFFDVEEDLLLVQLSIMTDPEGDCRLEGTGGLRVITSLVRNKVISIYYAYFENFGVVYLNWFDFSNEAVEFSPEQKEQIRLSIEAAEREMSCERTPNKKLDQDEAVNGQ